jgi:exonuclease III
MFNCHLAYAPYQPYQLLKIPYEEGRFIDTADEAVSEANLARDEGVRSLIAEIEAVRDQGTPIFVTGDFNEPSPLDWTDAVAQAKRVPVAVKWPSAGALLKADFLDTYREVHPDPLKTPGYTWTPTTRVDDPKDHHDRIDFVLASGHGLRVPKSEVVGERSPEADIVVTPYPSDHRAVVSTVTLE